MELTIRPLTENDYNDILVGWWKGWKWEAPLQDFLPDNGKGGFMVEYNGEPVCAGFIYMTNSKVAWVDWIISSNTFRKKPYRKLALEYLIESLSLTARNLGYEFTYALIKHQGLIDTYKKAGYVCSSVYQQEMLKKL